MITETEKSHSMPPASWRPRKAGGPEKPEDVVPVKTPRPEDQES